MATTESLLAQPTEARGELRKLEDRPLITTAGLTLAALLIHGYHPFAEDAGVYLPGILKLLHPDLYPTWTGFVLAQSRFSLFAPIIAFLARFSHLNLMYLVLGIYLVSIWGALVGVWMLADRCFPNTAAPFCAAVLLALVQTTPVAGTSLILIDPYLTARSVCTPLCLFALVGFLDFLVARRCGDSGAPPALRCAGSLLLAVLAHPLMAAYTAGCIALLACFSVTYPKLRTALFAAIGLACILTASIVNHTAAPPPGYATVALTRTYWFLKEWHWYEITGVVAPLLILFAAMRDRRLAEGPARWIAQATFVAGSLGLAVSVLFVHESGPYFTAMLQPLRIFQMVYIILIVFLGAALARSPLHHRRGSVFLFIVMAPLMWFVQVRTYPNSSHLEMPWSTPVNGWERGFDWIRENTPVRDTFALDSDYALDPTEDAQNFRAIAERSSVPDIAKDGGIAAIDPELTRAWLRGVALQTNLVSETDIQRAKQLRGAGVQWVVLPANSQTALTCPYQNQVMKVCKLL